MEGQQATFDFGGMDLGHIDLSTVYEQDQSFQKTAAEGSTDAAALFFGDEGIDTTASFDPSFDTVNAMYSLPLDASFGVQHDLPLAEDLDDAAWATALNDFTPTMESFDSGYQNLNANSKRPLDTCDFPQIKRHTNTDFTSSSFTSPYMTPLSASTTPIWSQPTSLETSQVVGLTDAAADVCAKWFSTYAVLPSDRHIDSLSQLTNQPAPAIRQWFGQMLKQGMAGHDSAYKSQTSLGQGDQIFPEMTTQSFTGSTTASISVTANDTTSDQPLRGGKKGCRRTTREDLLCRDPNKIYQCTRKCGKRYVRKCDWKRNEEEGYPAKAWSCHLCKVQGVERVKPCFRKYHFAQHFRNIHPGVDYNEHEQASIVQSETTFPRKCGFCTHRFNSRRDRIDHIADHFKQGKCMLDWQDDEDEKNGSDDMDDDDSDQSGGDGFQGDHDTFGAPPDRKRRPRNNGSDGHEPDNSNFGPFSGFSSFQLSKPYSDAGTQGERASQHINAGTTQRRHRRRSSIQSYSGNNQTTKDDTNTLARDDVAGALAMKDGKQSACGLKSSLIIQSVGAAEASHSAITDESKLNHNGPSQQSAEDHGKRSTYHNIPRIKQEDDQGRSLLSSGLGSSPNESRGHGTDIIGTQPNDTKQSRSTIKMRDAADAAVFAPQILLHQVPSIGKNTKAAAFAASQQLATTLATEQNEVKPLRYLPDMSKILRHLIDLRTAQKLAKETEVSQPKNGLAMDAFDKSTVATDTRAGVCLQNNDIAATVLPENHKDAFLSIKLLGAGGFSTVDEVIHQQTKLRVSRKTLKNREQSALEEVKKEVSVLQKLRHPHIIRYLGTYAQGDKVSILLSPVADTTLAVWLDQCYQDRPSGLDGMVNTMFGCLSSSLRYLHEQRPVIKHCDIKPQNILVMQGEHGAPHVILSDFGTSSSDEASLEERTQPLTRQYCAPEVPAGSARGQASDVWSLGCVFLEMFAVLLSEENAQWRALRNEFAWKYYWQEIPRLHESLLNFKQQAQTSQTGLVLSTIKAMLEEVPEHRPTAASLTLIFTPAACCVGWANEDVSFPGPLQEHEIVKTLVSEGTIHTLPELHTCAAHHCDRSLAQTRDWLHMCAHDHEACGNGDGTTLPTRLVDLCPEDACGEDKIRIVSSEELEGTDDQVKYVVLSHTWKDDDLTLTGARLSNMKRGFSQTDMPKAIANAMSVARATAHRYLWADSLCVIQDSDEDKMQECNAMAAVYRNASLTIVARSDANQETSPARPGATEQVFNMSSENTHVESLHQPSTILPWHKPGFAWETRAWSLQELPLSHRTLYLTGSQMYWECNTLKASETFPHGLPSLLWERVHTKQTHNTPPLSSDPRTNHAAATNNPRSTASSTRAVTRRSRGNLGLGRGRYPSCDSQAIASQALSYSCGDCRYPYTDDASHQYTRSSNLHQNWHSPVLYHPETRGRTPREKTGPTPTILQSEGEHHSNGSDGARHNVESKIQGNEPALPHHDPEARREEEVQEDVQLVSKRDCSQPMLPANGSICSELRRGGGGSGGGGGGGGGEGGKDTNSDLNNPME